MRKQIAKWLRIFAEWLDPMVKPSPLVPEDIYTQALELVQRAEITNHTGSYKRAQVMIELTKARPTQRRRDLALAIELAMRELP